MSTHPTTDEIRLEIQSLEQYLDELQMVPATALYRNEVLLGLLSKSLTVSRAVCALIDGGFLGEAFGVSRTLIEIFFCVRYISNKDTELRAETYFNYAARMRVEWKNIIEKHFPNTSKHFPELDKGLLDTAQKVKLKGSWTGHGGQAKVMALEEDTFETDELGRPLISDFDYDALHFWTSHFVHATVDGIEAHGSERGEVFKVRANIRVEEKFARLSIFNILIFTCKTFIHAFRAMNEDQPPAVLRMHQMIVKWGDNKST